MDYGVDVSNVVAIVVTCAGHERSARVFASESGAPSYLPELDASWVEDSASFEVYANGDDLPGGLKAIEISGGEKKEFALLSSLHGGNAVHRRRAWNDGQVDAGRGLAR